jgi:hypothetical protein
MDSTSCGKFPVFRLVKNPAISLKKEQILKKHKIFGNIGMTFEVI